MGVAAGTMDSRNGSATAAPAPRRRVLRDMCFFVIHMVEFLMLASGPPSSSVRYTASRPPHVWPVPPRWSRSTGRPPFGGCGILHIHLERRALDDAQHQIRERIILRRSVPDDRAHQRHILVLDAAAHSVG